jgi:hypothetical protein
MEKCGILFDVCKMVYTNNVQPLSLIFEVQLYDKFMSVKLIYIEY